jgi:hypothetical protein
VGVLALVAQGSRMSRPFPALRRIRDLADTQLGLVTAAQLAALGVRTGTTSRRVAGGMWTRVLPGIHLVLGGLPVRLQRELAALLYCGAGAMLTGLTALRYYGVRAVGLQHLEVVREDNPEPVHVLIPHARRRLSTGYVRAERTTRMPGSSVRRHGLELAPVARAVADAARRMRDRHDVDALVSEVVHRGLATIEEIRRELDDGQRRGSGLLRDAVEAVEAGARSGPEATVVRVFTEAKLPHVLYNVQLYGPDGEYIATPDAWLDDVGVAVEVDSVEHHADGEGFRRTIRRNARYAAAGVPVVTLLPTDIDASPTSVLATVLAARESAQSTPRPDVRVVRQEQRSAGRRAWRWGA